MGRRCWITMLVIAGCAVLVRIAVALAFPNVAWPDEIFQTAEQAHRIAFGDGLVPWEFREGARSWLLPGVLAAIDRASGPAYLPVTVTALAAVSLIPVIAVFRAVVRRGALLPAAIAAIVVASWFELVYYGPKALNEVVAAHLLVGALALLAFDRTPASRRQLAAAGALAALAIGLRIHLAPCGLVLLGLAWRRADRRVAPFVIAGLVVVLGLGALDWVTWGSPFASYVTTIRFNLIEGRSQLFGTSPWWGYLAALARTWQLGGLVVLALALVGARRDRWPLVLAAVILVTHSVIGHKEYRFIVPAIVLVIYSAGLGAAELVPRVRRSVAVLCTVAWCALSFGLALRVDTSMTTLGVQLTGSGWQLDHQRDGLVIMRRAGALEPLCGLGLVEVPWYLTGGYTWFDRHVPMESIFDPGVLARETAALDALVAPATIAIAPPYTRVGCEGQLCLWHRDGPCVAPAHDLRDALGDPSPSSVVMPQR
ncbi:MAG: hypothetical protein ABI467_03790 [Kofleriaceae bacterium]